MNIGIIGAGAISTSHIESYQKCGATVLAIADRSEENARLRAETHGIGRVYTEVAALLADPDVEAVSIATPVSSHCALTLAALAAGKHVLCEKPPAMSADEVRAMIAARDASGKHLQFGLVCRFKCRTEAMRRAYTEGRFGKLLFGEAGRLARTANPGGWFSDRRYTKGGALFDAAIHEIDELLYIIGYPKIRTVRAFLGGENRDLAERLGKVGKGWASATRGTFENDVETSATVFAVTEDGIPLVFRSTAATATVEEGPYVKLTGSHGGFVRYGKPASHFLSLADSGFGEEEITEEGNAFDRQIAHFLDCCRHGTPCMASAEDALALMQFYDAVYRSAEEGREITL